MNTAKKANYFTTYIIWYFHLKYSQVGTYILANFRQHQQGKMMLARRRDKQQYQIQSVSHFLCLILFVCNLVECFN